MSSEFAPEQLELDLESPKELGSPPATEVIWVGGKRGEAPTAAVRAQTWFEARKKIMTALGLGPDEVDCVRQSSGY